MDELLVLLSQESPSQHCCLKCKPTFIGLSIFPNKNSDVANFIYRIPKVQMQLQDSLGDVKAIERILIGQSRWRTAKIIPRLGGVEEGNKRQRKKLHFFFSFNDIIRLYISISLHHCSNPQWLLTSCEDINFI